MKNPSDLPPQDPGSNLPVRRRDAAPLSPSYQLDVPPPIDVTADTETGGLVEYWRILRRRKGTVILFAFLGTIAAILLSLPQTPIYQAHSTLEMLNINEDLLNKRQLDPNSALEGWDPQFNIKTQMSILQSKTLSERVAAKMKGLYKDGWPAGGSRLSAWRKALGLKPAQPPTSAAKSANGVYTSPGCGLSINTIAGTRLVQILCDSPDPKFAAEYVNTLANEFIDQNVEVRYQASQRTGEWLNRQLDGLKIKLEKSEAELQDSARISGLQFTGEKSAISEEKLKQVQAALSNAQADRAAKQSLYELAASQPPESLPEILDDTAIDEHQSKLAELRRQLAELSTTLTPQNTKVKRVQAQITEAETALKRQRANVIARIRNDYDAALRREKILAADYADQSHYVTEEAQKAIHYNILKREVDSTRQLYDSMLQKVKEYGIASAMQASSVRVVDPAEPPGSPYKPDHIQNAALGFMVGLFLGVAFVMIRERADRSIQAPGETALYINAPEFGVIPSATVDALQQEIHSKNWPSQSPRPKAEGFPASGERLELITFQRKPTLIAESFRTVLASILFSGQNGDHPRVIVLTSPAPKEGKTTVVSNLGLALAEINSRVLLIDADFRRPRLHDIFGVPDDRGLVDILMDRGSPISGDPIGVETRYPGLFVLPSGKSSHTAINLLYSPRLRELLARSREEFDMTIIDSPPMMNMSDARVVSRVADGVLIVIRAGQTTRDAIQSAAQRFFEDGTPILGTILNDWNPGKNAGSGYGYHYRSYDHYYEHYYKDYGPNAGDKSGRP